MTATAHERAVGSGLGLAIVKELTAAMGGGVTAAGRARRRGRVQIRVPTADARQDRGREPTPSCGAGC